MATERQIAANGADAAKSTRPETPVDRKNSARRSLLAHFIVPKGAPPVRFPPLLSSSGKDCQPFSSIRANFVETMAVNRWRQMWLAVPTAEAPTANTLAPSIFCSAVAKNAIFPNEPNFLSTKVRAKPMTRKEMSVRSLIARHGPNDPKVSQSKAVFEHNSPFLSPLDPPFPHNAGQPPSSRRCQNSDPTKSADALIFDVSLGNNMRVQVVDSHTGGEPTRLVLRGGPNLGGGSVSHQLNVFRAQHDRFRSGLMNEPRGTDAVVGAFLCMPAEKQCQLGVIFFNNVGYLGMCGHGTIGLCATLAQLGRLPLGEVMIETPVGVVSAHLHSPSEVTVRNVPSYRHRKDVSVEVNGYGKVTGDVAWGGNWFFFVKGDSPIPLRLQYLDDLTNLTWRIRQALKSSGIAGAEAEGRSSDIDHIELFGPPDNRQAHRRNFVLCPGKSYDRSPCGTGTSAKMACLYGDGLLQPGEIFIQESICGSQFEGRIEVSGDQIVPYIKGSAFITSESELHFNPDDPFCWGIPA